MTNTPYHVVFATLALLAGTALAAPALADSTQPAHHARHHTRALKRQAAVAPLAAAKPATQPVADNRAPMPDESVTSPIDPGKEDTSVAPAVMQIHYPPMGDGYTSGSSAQAMDDHDAAKVTGVQITTPLGQ